MDSTVSPALIFVPAIAVAVVASGCANSADDTLHRALAGTSDHTLQELCDTPRQFYTTEFNADNLHAAVSATAPMTAKIAGGNGCDYHTADGNYLGAISLFHLPDTPDADAGAEHEPVRTIVVDGTAIKESAVPAANGETDSEPKLTLSTTANGWIGKFTFWGRDDRTITAGGKVLVGMVRTLAS